MVRCMGDPDPGDAEKGNWGVERQAPTVRLPHVGHCQVRRNEVFTSLEGGCKPPAHGAHTGRDDHFRPGRRGRSGFPAPGNDRGTGRPAAARRRRRPSASASAGSRPRDTGRALCGRLPAARGRVCVRPREGSCTPTRHPRDAPGPRAPVPGPWARLEGPVAARRGIHAHTRAREPPAPPRGPGGALHSPGRLDGHCASADRGSPEGRGTRRRPAEPVVNHLRERGGGAHRARNLPPPPGYPSPPAQHLSPPTRHRLPPAPHRTAPTAPHPPRPPGRRPPSARPRRFGAAAAVSRSRPVGRPPGVPGCSPVRPRDSPPTPSGAGGCLR